MSKERLIAIRAFGAADAAAVEALFLRVNRDLAPPDQVAAFDAYVARALREEIGRIEAYYSERGGQFFVAIREQELVGMYGYETADADAVEIRRMYVAPEARRQGIAQALLNHAEATAIATGHRAIVLSTSELQVSALQLYRTSGFTETHNSVANEASNKTVGHGLRRYYFEKRLAMA